MDAGLGYDAQPLGAGVEPLHINPRLHWALAMSKKHGTAKAPCYAGITLGDPRHRDTFPPKHTQRFV